MLPRDLIDLMRDMNVFPVVLGSVSQDNEVHLAFVSWVYPMDERRIRVAVSSNSKSAKNLLETKKASIMLFAPDKALSCYGSAELLIERIESVKFPVSVFEIGIDRVENNLFPGATIVGTIPFVHTGDLKKAVDLDLAVLEALKSQ